HVPANRPVVFIVRDRDWNYVSLEGHMIRAALPAARLRGVYVYAGSPRAYLEHRPTLAGPGAVSAISRSYFRFVQPLYPRDPVAIMLSSFDDRYFPPWKASHPATLEAPGVAVVHGPMLAAPLRGSPPPIGRLSIVKIGALAVGTFIVLWLAGIGWAVVMLTRWAGGLQVVALAPAVGTAALV